jgi:glucose/arabinose dehydrogenase
MKILLSPTYTRFASAVVVITIVTILVFGSDGIAQQQVPFQGGIPVAPTGLRSRTLPTGPIVYDTAEDMDIQVSVAAGGLTFPFSLAFLPNGDMLVTERTGNLRIVRDGVVDPDPVAGMPESVYRGISGMPGAVHGLMDIALHPQFDQNQFVYFTYTKPLENGQTIALARGQWNGEALTGTEDVLVTERGGGGARFTFGPDGKIFMSVGGGPSQNGDSHGGKVLRLNDDGSAPDDNPFVDMDGYLPEIYSLGHRTALGLAIHPATGNVWQNENGPNGGDEINIILPGRNYGWPEVSYGRTYQGPWQAELPTHSGFEPPTVFWMPSIAISGMAFYTGDRLSKWKGDVFVGGLRYGEIPGTGHLERILFNENMEELRRESLLVDLRQRIRDVRMGPDELLYVVTDEEDGAILRIEPAP